MEAKLKHQGEVSIVTIKGQIEIEQSQQFQSVCSKNMLNSKVVFNMQDVSFVGSTGLKNFIETVKTMSQKNMHGLKIVGAKSEFKRIFANLDCQNLQIHETETAAVESFTTTPVSE